jgi:hypothetical protein
MAGHIYVDGLWVSQGDPKLVNETTGAPGAGEVTQFVAGQLGKEINLTDPTNSGALLPLTWKYVSRSGAAINAPYAVVQWADAEAFDFELADGGGPLAGVAFCDDDNASVPDRGVQVGNYGFIVVGGIVLVQSGAGVAAGDVLASQDDGTVDTAAAVTENLIGTAIEAVDATLTGHVKVLLDIPRVAR